MSENASIRLLGIRISVVDVEGVLIRIAERVGQPGCALVNNVNIRACNLAVEQPDFRRILNESAVVFCDGFGVKLAARLRGQRLDTRMTPPDWVDRLFAQGVEKGWTFFFVGDEAPVAEAFARVAKERHPGLNVAGIHHGFFRDDDETNAALLARLREFRPDIVLTGMGMPRQEYWADHARQHLDHGVIVATGALFRWYTGIERRAPRWMSAHGLEWLHRLLTRPTRNFRRYVLGIPKFYWRVLTRPNGP
ncbi:MAG: WecB/TagA/CpsF family glycosyltransferase [Kiritimatiellae bacterium]|nr:WecB/TagA/CpsF family glycosyltransferase [Kiritimatiellia bacterium]